MGVEILDLKEQIVANFDYENWQEIGIITGSFEWINSHPRLLRSLSWGDEDYGGHVLSFLQHIMLVGSDGLEQVRQYIEKKYPSESEYISSKPSEKKITFAPNVFEIPNASIEKDLVAVMMPFSSSFDGAYKGINQACSEVSLRCNRADNIWEESKIIQDIFNLIYRSTIVIVDFTGKNANVMYETGIAHTLGKLVVPISQSLDDVPFDTSHHRVLKYYPNEEGLIDLKNKLVSRLEFLKQ